jgi:hypothetical protein
MCPPVVTADISREYTVVRPARRNTPVKFAEPEPDVTSVAVETDPGVAPRTWWTGYGGLATATLLIAVAAGVGPSITALLCAAAGVLIGLRVTAARRIPMAVSILLTGWMFPSGGVIALISFLTVTAA